MSRSRLAPILALAAAIAIGGVWTLRVTSDAPAGVTDWPEVATDDPPLIGVYEGRLPCFRAGCTSLPTALALFGKGSPRAYRLRVPGGESEGRVTSRTGIPGYPSAEVLLLQDAPAHLGRIWFVTDDLILPLDEQFAPTPGTASAGATLSRTR